VTAVAQAPLVDMSAQIKVHARTVHPMKEDTKGKTAAAFANQNPGKLASYHERRPDRFGLTGNMLPMANAPSPSASSIKQTKFVL
jgi:hypothetical protein